MDLNIKMTSKYLFIKIIFFFFYLYRSQCQSYQLVFIYRNIFSSFVQIDLNTERKRKYYFIKKYFCIIHGGCRGKSYLLPHSPHICMSKMVNDGRIAVVYCTRIYFHYSQEKNRPLTENLPVN